MKVLKLNAYFSLMFILWCFFVIYMATYFYEIFGSSVKLVQGFYLIVAFAVYQNIWASKNEEYARKCFRVSIGGFALVSVAQILLCFYCASFLGDPRGRYKDFAEAVLHMLIPALPLSLFGFSLSFYCNLKITVPFRYYRRAEYFALFPIYAVLAICLSSSVLYWIAITHDVIYTKDVIATHSSIILASFLIVIGFISFKKQIFFAAFCYLSFAAFNYCKIVGLISYNFLIEKAFSSNNLKADYYFLLFHLVSVLIFIFIGIPMTFYASRPFRPNEKCSIKQHKIYVASKETLPFTVCQKC